MAFGNDSEVIARDAMHKINPELVEPYGLVIRFLTAHPEAASALRGANAPAIGSSEYIQRQANSFAASRKPKAPQPPETVPDEMVSLILQEFFNVKSTELERIKYEHLLSMGAENVVGDILERYLASVLEPEGWIWCSGAMVKAVDFVKPKNASGDWQLLQVKNRDNSENSSSSAIRAGTKIEKWHRTFSKKAETNWGMFPDTALRSQLSESSFIEFVKHYIAALK